MARLGTSAVGLWRASAVLALAGIGISGYLTLTSLQGTSPVCLAGDCAAVAASPYARFLGLPTAAWGLGTYVVVALLAVAGGWRRPPQWAPLLFLGLTVFAVTFSAYLLWVQVAVLRAVCSWCLSSDIAWTLLLVLAVLVVRRAYRVGPGL